MQGSAPELVPSQDLTYSDTVEEGRGSLGRKHNMSQKKNIRDGSEERVQSKGRSKDEARELRKKMMKYDPMEASGMKKRSASREDKSRSTPALTEQLGYSPQQGKAMPKPELLQRLAKGEKVEVDKEDMLKLTNKNYNNLPEVKKKKEELERKEDLKKRAEKQKNFGKELRERSRGKDGKNKDLPISKADN